MIGSRTRVSKVDERISGIYTFPLKRKVAELAFNPKFPPVC